MYAVYPWNAIAYRKLTAQLAEIASKNMVMA
jgi:hypothetical protein